MPNPNINFIPASLPAGANIGKFVEQDNAPCATPVYETPATSGVTGQISLNAVQAQRIISSNPNRRSIKITNLGTEDVYIAFGQNASTITGDLLVGVKGAFVVIPATLEIWAIATGAVMISYMELSA